MTKPTQLTDRNAHPVSALRPALDESVDGSSASASSAVINATSESIVRVASSSDINLAFGATPTASASTLLLPAGVVEYFRVKPNEKVAVLGGIAIITTTE